MKRYLLNLNNIYLLVAIRCGNHIIKILIPHCVRIAFGDTVVRMVWPNILSCCCLESEALLGFKVYIFISYLRYYNCVQLLRLAIIRISSSCELARTRAWLPAVKGLSDAVYGGRRKSCTGINGCIDVLCSTFPSILKGERRRTLLRA